MKLSRRNRGPLIPKKGCGEVMEWANGRCCGDYCDLCKEVHYCSDCHGKANRGKN